LAGKARSTPLVDAANRNLGLATGLFRPLPTLIVLSAAFDFSSAANSKL